MPHSPMHPIHASSNRGITRLAMLICTIAALICLPASSYSQRNSLDVLRSLDGISSTGNLANTFGNSRSFDALDPFKEESLSQEQLQRYQLNQFDAETRDLSLIEEDYNLRYFGLIPVEKREQLRLFGYDNLASQQPQTSRFATGQAGEGYIVGIGDTLAIALRGQTIKNEELVVNRAGQLLIGDIPPLNVAGKPLGQVQLEVQEAAEKHLGQTSTFVSLASTRMINILVMGAVPNAGVQQLTSFASILDALVLAGGVQPQGSLRGITLYRGGEQSAIDLYDYFIGSADAPDISLRDGDRLIVPPIGDTIAVVGDVGQQGIFELPAGTTRINRDALLRYAGGQVRRNGNAFVRQYVTSSGEELVESLASSNNAMLNSNDILIVQRKQGTTQNVVYLDGHVYGSGKRSLQQSPTVAALLKDDSFLKPDTYRLFAALIREKASGGAQIIPVNIQDALSGKQAVALKNNDRLVVFSNDDVRYLWSADVYALLNQQLPPSFYLTAMQQQGGTASSGEESTDNTNPLAAAGLSRQQLQQLAQQQGGQLAALANTQQQNRTSQQPRSSDGVVPTDIDAEKPFIIAQGGKDNLMLRAAACDGLLQLAHAARSVENNRFLHASRALNQIGKTMADDLGLQTYRSCPEVFRKHGDLLPAMLDHVVAVTGAVTLPGAYPVAQQTTLGALIDVAGGLTEQSGEHNISLTRFIFNSTRQMQEALRTNIPYTGTGSNTDVLIPSSSFLLVQQQATEASRGVVELLGQFRHPGIYDIRQNETLSSLIERAGGYSEQAYPYGAIFMRQTIKEQEKRNYERLAQQLQSGLLANFGRLQTRGNADSIIAAVSNMVETLKNTEALGRMVIEADFAKLTAEPALDVLLEPGDRLFVPKRPSYVMVSGEVLNAGAQQFRSDWEPRDYIEAAGGTQYSADEKRVFAVLPNGQAQPLSLSSWNYRSTRLPPGTTIIVPADPVPLDMLSIVRDTSGILGQLALTAASIAVIGRD